VDFQDLVFTTLKVCIVSHGSKEQEGEEPVRGDSRIYVCADATGCGGESVTTGYTAQASQTGTPRKRHKVVEAAHYEVKPDFVYIQRHGGQPEGAVEVGQFWLSYSL
jgi:hypothetical protein